MKNVYTLSLTFFLLLTVSVTRAQLNNGGIHAGFGVDADTRSNYVKYGPITGNIPSDDWFSFDGVTRNVIDTSNSAYFLSLLSGGGNNGFMKGMAVPLYSRIGNKLWIDAVYGRDYIATSPFVDSTAFTIACKNGDDPDNWQGGATNFPDKNDLTDVFAHMRRDGVTINDSLWLFTGVSTVGTSGSRYIDIELYKNSFSYNAAAGTFSSAGTDAGHTQWLFDASGNIIQTGDMIIAVNYSPGSAPVVDVRIWVSQATFSTVNPAYFDFGATLDGATPAFGYASLLSNSGGNAFGSGIANFSATPAQDTTYSTPWGTELDTKVWGTQYQSIQFIEVGLNLTRMGVDPALYTAQGLDPCESMFSSIFFKSRSSNSFTSNMHDFMTPMAFMRNATMDYTVQSNPLSCAQSTGSITLVPNSSAGYFTWQTPDGNISTANTDSSQLTVSSTGTYIVSASAVEGCPVSRTDTIQILKDTFPPVASVFATLGSGSSYIQLLGGDPVASNYSTPFGGSQGLLWDWSGPASFTSAIQNPTNDTIWGTYQLIVTELRNGCKDTATADILRNLFTILAQNSIDLEGTRQNAANVLSWQGKNMFNVNSYTIERSSNGKDFSSIGEEINVGNDQYLDGHSYFFRDENAGQGKTYYRIKTISKGGIINYSNVVFIDAIDLMASKPFITAVPDGYMMVYPSAKMRPATMVLYSESGQILERRILQLVIGNNNIPITTAPRAAKGASFVSLFIDGQVVYSGKLIR